MSVTRSSCSRRYAFATLSFAFLYLATIGTWAPTVAQSPANGIPEPFSSNYSLKCASPSATYGSYRPVPPEDSIGLGPLAKFAFEQWFNESAANIAMTCNPENVLHLNTDVVGACSQLVNGRNYALLLNGYASCLHDNSTAVMVDEVALASIIYVPLSGSPRQVTYSAVVAINENFYDGND